MIINRKGNLPEVKIRGIEVVDEENVAGPTTTKPRNLDCFYRDLSRRSPWFVISRFRVRENMKIGGPKVGW